LGRGYGSDTKKCNIIEMSMGCGTSVRKSVVLICAIFLAAVFPDRVNAQSISNIVAGSNSIPVYSKYEVRFNVGTTAKYPFFQYDESPPSGIMAKIGVTVEGVITAPSGKVSRQPAFFTNEVLRTGSGSGMRFEETGKSYWAVRFSPQESGVHGVTLSVRDASGIVTQTAGSFTATSPTKDGFVGVSKNDTRYFEFSNGKLFWPIGPAWGDDYAKYVGTGQNLERPWMAGNGTYSTNWARWKSSAEQFGNEGIKTRLNWREHAPGSELSYELFYPEGYRMWLTFWLDEMFGLRLKNGFRYQVKLTFKTVGVAGPRNAALPYGFVVKAFTPDIMWNNHTQDQFDAALRDPQSQVVIADHVKGSNDWQTLTGTFTANSDWNNIYLYLDNVTGGQVYVDEFSMKEILPDGSFGGEQVRNPKADMHTYAESRSAAYFDWQLEQGEANGVYFKYVVHDKNDWIQAHLKSTGEFSDVGDGYYQDENTKARWLLRQWYRYLAARYGYSTAVHSWELNNEGPPNQNDGTNPPTSVHWRTAQAFAKFMHQIDSHPHLATTSFWCCWRPEFWGNDTLFPDIDYADLHEYTSSTLTAGGNYSEDMAEFVTRLSATTWASQVGKPVVIGETGITDSLDTNNMSSLLRLANPGIWYHNILWAQLHPGSAFVPNYWFFEHLSQISRETISRPFYLFIKDLDVNKGGYVDAAANTTNTNLRAIGQKNPSKNAAYLWIQNKDHTWKKYMDGIRTSYSGTIKLNLNPNILYKVDWWNTTTGAVASTQIIQANNAGEVSLSVGSLADDVAVKISSVVKFGDANSDGKVDGIDYVIWLNHYGQNVSSSAVGDFNSDNRVDGIDYVVWLNNYGG